MLRVFWKRNLLSLNIIQRTSQMKNHGEGNDIEPIESEPG